jgi:hypothetical protein
MTREEIISGLKFTVEMFLLNPSTGEIYTEPRNDMDKTTIDACRGAIEVLKQEPSEDCISRQAVLDIVNNPLNIRLDEIIKKLPPVTPTEKVGHWEYVQYDGNPNIGNWHCSECRSIFIEGVIKREKDSIPFYKYCPQCGAKMKEGD